MQFGFMKGKETTDAIFIVRQMKEKIRAKGKKLNFGFVDLKKAFDRVPLHYRQVRGDTREVYKGVSGKYDSVIAPTLIMSDTHKTRGNDLKLQTSCLKYDMRKFYFSNRVVDQWNSLPNWVVTANNTN